MSLRIVALGLFVALLACAGGPDDNVLTPQGPGPEAPPTEVPTEAAPPPMPDEGFVEKAPEGGWIQDEVIYDAEGNVYGCMGGGNWCAKAPPRDPVTHAPRGKP